MAEHCRGGVIYFARDGSHPVLREHRSKGHRTAFVREGSMVLAEGDAEELLASLADVPLTRSGKIVFQVENALAAAASGWALGLPLAAIRAGLASFEGSSEHVPGRFNVINAGGATVIVDSARNPSAIEAVVATLGAFQARRHVAVLSADGDHRDEEIVSQGTLLAPWVDRVILHEEPARILGRKAGAITALLRRGLESGPRAPEIVEARTEAAAITHALSDLQADDLLLVLVGAIDGALAQVNEGLRQRNALGGNAEPRP
jgi:cyanophycin synthetase